MTEDLPKCINFAKCLWQERKITDIINDLEDKWTFFCPFFTVSYKEQLWVIIRIDAIGPTTLLRLYIKYDLVV